MGVEFFAIVYLEELKPVELQYAASVRNVTSRVKSDLVVVPANIGLIK